MRKIGVSYLKPEMLLARSIYNTDGRVLLRAGVSLNTNYIKRLKEIGILSVFVRDELSADINEIPEMVSEETRLQTKKAIREIYTLLEKKQGFDTRKVELTVGDLLDEILHNSDVMLGVLDMSISDDQVYVHSVNVGIMSIAMGMSLGYDRSKLKELGIGALLHDVGKTQLSRDALIRSLSYPHDDDLEVERHAQHGFDILRKYYGVSLLSAHVAFQHHERWDGGGYPRGLKEGGIHEYARIVAAANLYDQLTCRLSNEEMAVSTPDVLVQMQMLAGMEIDPGLVEVLASNLAMFQIGSVVQLNDSSLALIVEINRIAPDRPLIRVLELNGGMLEPSGPLLDMAKQARLSVVRTLPESEVQAMMQ